MDYTILKTFQEIQTTLLSFFANSLSFLGEELVIILISLIIFFRFSKKNAFGIVSSLILSNLFAAAIKAIVRRPRPFVKHPDLLADRLETAGGYSFPSMHTTISTSTYFSIASSFKKKGLYIFAFIISLLIGLSRNYLLVHYPSDVLVGFIIGAFFAFVISPYLIKKYDDIRWFNRFTLTLFVSCFMSQIVVCVLLVNNLVDSTAFSPIHDFLSLSSGVYLAFYLERKYVNFKECENSKQLILNIGVCLIFILIVFGISKLYQNEFIRHDFRYTILGLSVIYLYPLFATKVGLLKKNG